MDSPRGGCMAAAARKSAKRGVEGEDGNEGLVEGEGKALPSHYLGQGVHLAVCEALDHGVRRDAPVERRDQLFASPREHEERGRGRTAGRRAAVRAGEALDALDVRGIQ